MWCFKNIFAREATTIKKLLMAPLANRGRKKSVVGSLISQSINSQLTLSMILLETAGGTSFEAMQR